MADGFKIADAYVEIHVDDSAAKKGVDDLPAKVEPNSRRSGKRMGDDTGKGFGEGLSPRAQKEAEKAGNEAGKKFSNATSKSTKQLSPLIVAAVAGGMAAGAPAMLGAAGLLFAGIAVVAAAQSEKVKETFAGMQKTVQAEMQSVTTGLDTYVVQAIGRITNALGVLKPDLQSIFTDAGPLIATLTTGLINLVSNLMPGLVTAMHSMGPVFDGLSSLLGSIGTGLSNFFSIIATHSGASGAVFAQLGGVLEQLLPILGQLMGAGVELASNVLPSVVGALRLVSGVLSFIAPILPQVLGGFLAYKAISSVTPLFAKWAQGLATASYGGSAFAGSAGKVSTVVGTLGRALPVLGIAAVAVGTMFAQANSSINDSADALLKGGSAADEATAKLNAQKEPVHSLSGLWAGLTGGFTEGWSQLRGYSGSLDEATQKVNAQLAAMDPLTRAQTVQTQALNNLNDAIGKNGSNSDEARFALAQYKNAENDVKVASDEEQLAIHGVTDAMVEQANEALAAIDSSFALQHAQNAQRDAEIAVRDAIKQHGVASTAAHDAEQAYEESIYKTATASATLAADQAGLKKGTQEYSAFLDSHLLASLEQVSSHLTGPARDAVLGYISTLKAAGVTTDGLVGKTQTLGEQKPKPVADLWSAPFNGVYSDLMNKTRTLGGQRPTPTANVTDHATGVINGLMADLLHLNGTTATTYLDTYHREYFFSSNSDRLKSGGGAIHAASGKLVGPGNGEVDTIPAVGPGGSRWMLANDEWVIKARSARSYGDGVMQAINNGTATVTTPSGQTAGPNPTTGSGQSNGGGGVHIDNLVVQIDGTFDLTNPGQVRSAAMLLRKALIDLEREQS